MAEAAAVLGTTEISGSEFGHGIVVPTNSKSKLMYYLSCINTLLKKKGERTDPEIRKLSDYGKHHRLTEEETDKLILLCYLLSPDVLLNKCVFIDDEMCKDYDNNFYELNAVRNRFVVTRNLMIAGEQRTVHRIMACRKSWLDENWTEPMKDYKSRLAGLLSDREQEESSCAIL